MVRILLIALTVSLTASWVPPVEHATVDVNGVKLHYAKSGTGQLMVFLHGFPEFWYAWKDQLDEFGRDHLAVAPDMRGFNLSSKPEAVDQYRMPLLDRGRPRAGRAPRLRAEAQVHSGRSRLGRSRRLVGTQRRIPTRSRS